MRPWLTDLLACPSCRRPYAATALETDGEDLQTGWLSCACGVLIPVLEGFPLFGEPLAAEPSLADLQALAARLFGPPEAYAAYEADKAERGAVEAYAAFHPFNESTRAIEAVLPLVDARLKPGEAILDTWCRTGWNGEWLAGRFPAQKVVAYWEGDNSVLGYRGFRRWLNAGRRAANLDILFLPPERPLPFRDSAFAFVHAPDSLHRYGLYPFAAEALRVGAPDAVVAFPHVHLTNSEPDPFFERGCTQRHGRAYRQWLDRVSAGTPRQGWVLSEPDLFEGRARPPFADAPDTPDYNGFVLIAPDLVPAPAPAPAVETRYLLNPLFRLNFARRSARPDPTLFDGVAGYVFERHPIYRARLPEAPIELSDADFAALALAVTGATEAEVRAACPGLDRLIGADLLRPAPLSANAHELQRFHANQGFPTQAARALLARLDAADAPALHTAEGETLTGRELVGAAQSFAPQSFAPQSFAVEGGRLQEFDGPAFALPRLLALPEATLEPLVRAAFALRAAAPRHPAPLESLDALPDQLAALCALARGQAVQLSA